MDDMRTYEKVIVAVGRHLDYVVVCVVNRLGICFGGRDRSGYWLARWRNATPLSEGAGGLSTSRLIPRGVERGSRRRAVIGLQVVRLSRRLLGFDATWLTVSRTAGYLEAGVLRAEVRESEVKAYARTVRRRGGGKWVVAGGGDDARAGVNAQAVSRLRTRAACLSMSTGAGIGVLPTWQPHNAFCPVHIQDEAGTAFR